MTPLIELSGGDVAAIVGAALVLAGVIATAYFGFRSNQSTSAVAIAGQLAARVEKLEKDLAAASEKHTSEIDEIRGQLTMSQRAVIAAVRFIDRLVDWGKGGGRERMPTPPRDLHEFLDPEMWGTGPAVPTTGETT